MRKATNSPPALRQGASAGAPRIAPEVESVLGWLKGHSNKATREGMARYAIPSDHALGLTVNDLRELAKMLGRNHDLAAALWQTGVYEARMLTSSIDEPERVTAAQMGRWCRDFDNWGICDTLCVHLFDRTPHAWAKVAQWQNRRAEFEKRAAFALLWALAAHGEGEDEKPFREGVRYIERAVADNAIS